MSARWMTFSSSLSSEQGAQILGAEAAAANAEAARKAKEAGETVCICPACQAGAAILVDKEYLV